MVIGLCGATGAGKDAAARYFEQTHWSAAFKHSEYLRRTLRRHGVPELPANLSALFEANASVLGRTWVARETLADVLAHLHLVRLNVHPNAERTGPVVVNGIRNLAEVELYRAAFVRQDFRLVAIVAPRPLRFERVRNRGERENERDLSFRDFLAIEQLESLTEQDAVIAAADLEIRNDASLDAFHAQLRGLLPPES